MPNREHQYVEAKIKPASAEGFRGRAWDVTIIGPEGPDGLVTVEGREYVVSKNKRLYSVDALRESVPLWQGVKVYDNHLTDEEFQAKQGMRSVGKEWLGTIIDPYFDEAARALKAVLKIVDEPLAGKLATAYDEGVLESIGLSIDTAPVFTEVEHLGERMPAATGFEHIFSVDVVGDPAAGGRFERLIAAHVITDSKESTMGKFTPEQLEALLNDAEKVAQLRKALSPKKENEDESEAEPVAESEGAEAEGETVEEPVAESAGVESAEAEPAAEAAGAEAEPVVDANAAEAVRRLECQLMLHTKLDAAKLPAPHRQIVESNFSGRVFSEKRLDGMIRDMKKLQAQNDKSGQPTGAGATRESATTKVGLSPAEKAELEFMRLVMGNTAFTALEQSDKQMVKERVPESYTSWLKNGRGRYGYTRMSELIYDMFGDPFSGSPARAAEAVTTSSMTSIVKNTVNIMIANDYSVREEWWAPIVRVEEVDTIDDATLVRVYGLDNLDTVTEGGPYTEMDWADEEETASFVKRGNYVGVTMESLMRDKVQAIRTLPARLSNAWYNTLSALNSAVFTCNSATGPVLGTTGALFNATATSSAGGHANLGTSALSYTTLTAAEVAMMKQTDQTLGTGRRLNIRPRYVLVPVDLMMTAEALANDPLRPGTANNDANRFQGRVVPLVVPDWTDTDNWAAVADPQQFPAIWNIFYRGKRVPELFEASDETSGAMFTNDVLRYKIRQMTFRFSSTYDAAPVSDFRPLYKANV